MGIIFGISNLPVAPSFPSLCGGSYIEPKLPLVKNLDSRYVKGSQKNLRRYHANRASIAASLMKIFRV